MSFFPSLIICISLSANDNYDFSGMNKENDNIPMCCLLIDRLKRWGWLGVFLLVATFESRAQVDPTLNGLILTYTDKAEKQLKSQQRAMALETTGHVWMASEMEKTTDVQKAYNDYLDSFRDVVCYAAQIYGFYVEIDKLLDNMSDMNRVLGLHPSGAFATALSVHKNAIYRNLTLNSIGIVNDIRQVCLSNVKMTEKQRIEIVFNIRPKLVKMNLQLRRLTRAIKYSTFGDIWADIELLEIEKPDKLAIARDCIGRWKRKGHIAF